MFSPEQFATGMGWRSGPIRIEPVATGVGSLKTLEAQETLFFADDPAGHVYHVESGVLRACRLFQDGRRQVVSFVYPGELIGFGHGERYRFDCDALTAARVTSIPRARLFAAIRTDLMLGEKLLRAAADEIGAMHDLSMILCRKSALERVASFLLGLYERSGRAQTVSLPMTRADIADHLGLTVETISRNITKLRQRHVISLDGPATIVVIDPAGLHALSEHCEEVH